MSENPAGGHGTVPDTVSRSNSPKSTVSGMGTEGQAIGVITPLSVEGESHPPNTRTIQEPDREWLK